MIKHSRMRQGSSTGLPTAGCITKIYRGRRHKHGNVVTVDGKPLRLRLDLRNHSPTGFEWGYGGSGPAQLALAILTDYLGNDDKASRWYEVLKRKVIAGLPRNSGRLTNWRWSTRS